MYKFKLTPMKYLTETEQKKLYKVIEFNKTYNIIVEHEKDNEFDKNALIVFMETKKDKFKIGYLQKNDFYFVDGDMITDKVIDDFYSLSILYQDFKEYKYYHEDDYYRFIIKE